MANPDSDDYELMPRQELENLRREVTILKKNNLTEGDKAKALVESMEKLTLSINRLITILDDAEKDIIDEYQKSKPAEKLNQLAEQNDTIAKALIVLSEGLSAGNNDQGSRNILPSSQYKEAPTMPSPPNSNNPRNAFSMSDSSRMGNPGPMNFGSPTMPPLDDMPSMSSMPPLEGPPIAPKKKFLGLM